MNDQEFSKQEEDILKSIETNINNLETSTNRFFKRKLILFAVRWIITLGVYIWLWNKISWLKWTLILIVPLGIWNLYTILKWKKKTADKMEDVKKVI